LAPATVNDVPLDVVIEGGPSEVIDEGIPHGVDSLMPEAIVKFVNNSELMGRENEELVAASWVAPPKSSVRLMVPPYLPKKILPGFTGNVERLS
jgi:hypothetical protein